jgi:hypothetical protein
LGAIALVGPATVRRREQSSAAAFPGAPVWSEAASAIGARGAGAFALAGLQHLASAGYLGVWACGPNECVLSAEGVA